MENITLRIDQETQDLVLDDSGSLELIGDAETVAQCVRLTLETFKGEWFLDTDHGTDYDQSSRTATATLKPSSARRSSRRPTCNTSTA